ncbi:EutN/CcmL family microcompartment protein [Clostridium lacusfryxellense]|uniref:EutN/CcmL family microcompartment protein n=1 Tax=Clostridium lacusfryxellense TaxID=205328 RepID=UPI001C0BCD11|nr:EutN/CcmL family microcompartment protein [Clostridium lacusfryxellense]MBU3112754.1 EutN/CcmL family microcompartment protein [Clostridium lacusfryxellense]
MIIGKVIGKVISTRKNQKLVGNKFLIVEPLGDFGFDANNRIVAVDNVGAGVGEIVLVVTGSSARAVCDIENAPIDAAIVGIVDNEKDIMLDE